MSPKGLSALPFASVFRGGQYVPAADLGLRINPEGRVYVVPNIGGFVGADTVGVIVASELDLADGPRAAVDIGTNGEIVVSHAGALYACSTAAGPAFEGARIRQGMRAAAGAIDAVEHRRRRPLPRDRRHRPRGLCGSGLVDAVAGLVQAGVVAETGRLLPPEELPAVAEKVKRRVVENELGLEFILASAEETGLGRPVSVTARDVRELQLAKGAIFAGITLLLDRAGLTPMDLDRLLLAGAFGNYIRRESAIAIGLVPDLPRGEAAVHRQRGRPGRPAGAGFGFTSAPGRGSLPPRAAYRVVGARGVLRPLRRSYGPATVAAGRELTASGRERSIRWDEVLAGATWQSTQGGVADGRDWTI